MAQNMKDIGKTIYNMDMVLRLGLMGLGTKVIIKKVKSMEKALTPGVMARDM